MQILSIGEAIRNGWRIFKGHPLFFIGFFLLVLVLNLVLNYGADYFNSIEEYTLFEAIGVIIYFILFFIISIAVSVWMLTIILRVVDGGEPTLGSINEITPILINAVLSQLLVSLIVLGGFILFIIPGIIWSLKYKYTIYAIVDKKLGVMDALKYSGRITYGVKFDLMFLGAALGFIMLLGFLALFVGILVALPLVIVIDIWVYRSLQKQYDERETKGIAPQKGKEATA